MFPTLYICAATQEVNVAHAEINIVACSIRANRKLAWQHLLLFFSTNSQSLCCSCWAADHYLFTSPQECLITSVMVLIGLPMTDHSGGGRAGNIPRSGAAVSGQAWEMTLIEAPGSFGSVWSVGKESVSNRIQIKVCVFKSRALK